MIDNSNIDNSKILRPLIKILHSISIVDNSENTLFLNDEIKKVLIWMLDSEINKLRLESV